MERTYNGRAAADDDDDIYVHFLWFILRRSQYLASMTQ